MYQCTSIISILLIFASKMLFSQSITNIQSSVVNDKVEITYNLQCKGWATISLLVSEDGGKTFSGPISSLSGDVGNNIEQGDKRIIWEVLKDRDLLWCNNLVFRVKATNSMRSQFRDPRDGKTYNIVQIGNQVWMAENMAYQPGNGNSWAYDGNTSNVATYGYLYDWQTARNVCPTGWHLPEYEEWKTLNTYLGDISYWKTSVAWPKLKEAGTTHWKSNDNATNETGFAALPGGWRHYAGNYYFIRKAGFWWSATEYMSGSAKFWQSDIYDLNQPQSKDVGFSVRCVKD